MADEETTDATELTDEVPNVILSCTVSGQHLTRDDDTKLVRGQVAKVELAVAFMSLEWQGLSTYARFERAGKTVVDVAEEEGRTGVYLVPHEATDEAGTFRVALKGETADGLEALTSCPATYEVEDTIVGEGGEPAPATPSMLAQVVAAGEAASAAAAAAREAEETCSAAESARVKAEEARASESAEAVAAAKSAASAANGAASAANAAANTALEIANTVAQGAAGDSEVAELRAQNAQLASMVADLEDGYFVLGETVYAPASKASISGTTATVSSTSSVSGSTVTLA